MTNHITIWKYCTASVARLAILSVVFLKKKKSGVLRCTVSDLYCTVTDNSKAQRNVGDYQQTRCNVWAESSTSSLLRSHSEHNFFTLWEQRWGAGGESHMRLFEAVSAGLIKRGAPLVAGPLTFTAHSKNTRLIFWYSTYVYVWI